MKLILVRWLTLVKFCTLLEFLFVPQTSATCSPLYGPSGLVECVIISDYQYRGQWATCLTNDYIEQKSKGQHVCSNTTATYCWYQCMIETYNVEPGNKSFPSPVYDGCACGNGGSQTTQRSIPTSTLPPWCFSPSGQSCNWYNDCLEKRHPCEGTGAAYAITYAETFCNLYEIHATKFSQTGQNWINAVRKCLQVALVPILRPWVTISCDGIRQTAFNSHSECYKAPYTGAPSICDLPVKDWWEIFWTIKSAFTSNFVESLKGAVNILSSCGGKVLDTLVDMIKLKFKILRVRLNRNKRSTSDDRDELAGDVSGAIGSKLGWTDAGVMWHAYSDNSTSSDIVSVYVLITGRNTYDLNNVSLTSVNLTSVKEKVEKAVRNGDLFFSKVGSGSEPIYVKQMNECTDFACLKTTNEVTAPEKNWTCSQLYGTSGHVECVNLYPYYKNRRQWATCLSNDYIQQKSKGQHDCIDTTATFCWYQCMLETYNVEPGNETFPSPVYDGCACGNGGSQTTQRSIPMSTLPPWCFSPSGQSCNWYNDCLEKRHPCEGTGAAYAITYAETFCNLYEIHATKFSQTGQNWINAVRKCLQVALVPILRPWVTISCDGIRQTAFNSHSECYKAPYTGAPSICDLPVKDWWEIFWTIKSAFTSNFVESLKGAVNILSSCGGKVLDNHVDMIKLKFKILRVRLNRNKRSTSDDRDELAGDVSGAIGSKLGWTDAGVMWHAYSDNSTSSDIVSVYVLITGRNTYDLNNVALTSVNLTSVKEKVEKAVRNGDLFFSKVGSGSEPIYVKQMNECTDFVCLKTTNEVTAPEKNWTKNSVSHLIGHRMQITYSLLLTLIRVAFG